MCLWVGVTIHFFTKKSRKGLGGDVGWCDNLDGGVAVISGGKDGGKAYKGQWNQDWINANIEVSKDGHIYFPYDNKHYDQVPADAVSIRLTAKTTRVVGDDDNPTSPRTGDNSHLALLAMLMGAAFVGLVSCGILGKKRKTVK